MPAVSLLSVKYVFIIEASTASWLLIAILIVLSGMTWTAGWQLLHVDALKNI